MSRKEKDKITSRVNKAKPSPEKVERAVLEIISNQQVVYDRELRYRLEGDYPHDVTKAAIERLLRKGEIKKVSLPGRRGAGRAWPNVFYCIPGTPYKRLTPIMRQKLDLSVFISGIAPEMGRYAELVWFQAFKNHGWETKPEDVEHYGTGVREWNNKTATVPNDIDFAAIKDSVAYGVEVKNSLSYPDDLYWKIRVALEIELIPLLIVRWLNPAQQKILKEHGVPMVIYRTAIYSPTYRELIEEAKKKLGYPIEARDNVDPPYFKRKVEETHRQILENLEKVKRKMEEFKGKIEGDWKLRKTLGDKK